ncbi:MAG: hypothetical protein EA397_05020 [Deltaproteobacteria bacterium]|nr:MAG: hypothetical protein EA397_05020 [Deltaproteobacteria bacterium]
MRAAVFAVLILGVVTPSAYGDDVVSTVAGQLSVYPPGEVPADEATLEGIALLGRVGGPEELPLLRELVRVEGALVRERASLAIRAIRHRRAATSRASFLTDLPTEEYLVQPTKIWRRRGLDPAQARCAAYADAILGAQPKERTPRVISDVELERAAALLEQRGEIGLAIRLHAERAAMGHEPAFTTLEGFGVDPERLLLGLIATRRAPELETLAVLARRGERLTVEVLAERILRGEVSDQINAADALGRMLLVRHRLRPLSTDEVLAARKVLLQAATGSPSHVQPIARQALAHAEP